MNKFLVFLLFVSALVCSGMKTANAEIIPTATFYVDVNRTWLKYPDEWVTNPDEWEISFTVSVKVEDTEITTGTIAADLCLGLIFSSKEESPLLGSIMGYFDSFEIFDGTLANKALLFEGDFVSELVCVGCDTNNGEGVLVFGTGINGAIDTIDIEVDTLQEIASGTLYLSEDYQDLGDYYTPNWTFNMKSYNGSSDTDEDVPIGYATPKFVDSNDESKTYAINTVYRVGTAESGYMIKTTDGLNLAVVPEPATWLTLAGFGVVGAFWYRRRSHLKKVL